MTATPLALDPVTVADLASSRAAMFGIVVTDDITAPMNDAYRLTRARADTFRQAAFSGLASRSRFAPNPPNGCLYLFGSDGEHRSGQTASGSRRVAEILTEDMGLSLDPLPRDLGLNIDTTDPTTGQETAAHARFKLARA
ncbi:hypothetical protein ACIGDM_12475 [Rothia koreensis]|uniref:hypothetical protein n=1 Tax=Rothia koreensis TaxID=592378 RepID=UPI0037C77F76